MKKRSNHDAGFNSRTALKAMRGARKVPEPAVGNDDATDRNSGGTTADYQHYA